MVQFNRKVQMDVRAVIAGVEMWRGTGTLVVRSGDQECRLYFMVGTLYHAEGPGGVEGEAAVRVAASWTEFEHEFDTVSKLPTRETIGDDGVSSDDRDLADWARRDAENLRQRAVYVFGFLIVAGLLMIWLFSQRG